MINCIYNYHIIIYSLCKTNQSLYTEVHGKDMSPEGHMYSEFLLLFCMFMKGAPTKPAVSLLVLILFTGVLYEAETTYPPLAPRFTMVVLVMKPMLVVFLVFCLLLLVFVLCLVLSVDCVSGLSILYCPFGFLSHLY